MIKADNAVILAAGTSSRFAPLSYEKPKALIEVKGEVLIERQIRQLKDAGIPDIFIVTGYKAEQFQYLRPKYGVKLIYNPDFLTRNNNASIYVAKDVIRNTFICSSDNYFIENPFEAEVESAYYSAVYAEGKTAEWCMTEDHDGYINSVTVGGERAWYMLGHTFWDENFSTRFLSILADEYNAPVTADKLWETIFMEHLDVLKMKIRRYVPNVIFEFDTLDELRQFDPSYVDNTRSTILKNKQQTGNKSETNLLRLPIFLNGTREILCWIYHLIAFVFASCYTHRQREKGCVQGLLFLVESMERPFVPKRSKGGGGGETGRQGEIRVDDRCAGHSVRRHGPGCEADVPAHAGVQFPDNPIHPGVRNHALRLARDHPAGA